MVSGSPAPAVLQTEHDHPVTPDVRHVRVGRGALSVPDVHNDVGVQRVLLHLIGGQLMGEQLTIGAQIEGDDLRRTHLVDGDRCVHHTRIDDPQALAFVHVQSVDGHQFGAVGTLRIAVGRPVRIRDERRGGRSSTGRR